MARRNPNKHLPATLIASVRSVQMGETRDFDISFDDVIEIARERDLLEEFIRQFAALNHDDLKAAIRRYLKSVADELDGLAAGSNRFADLVHNSGRTVAIGVTVAAAGMLIVGTGGLAAPWLLGAGLIGVAGTGGAVTAFKTRADTRTDGAKRIRTLLSEL